MHGPTQVLADCPNCHVESALVELIDPSERIGVAIEGRCRLCGYGTELGEVVAFGQPFVDPVEVIEALTRWAAADGEPDVVVFVTANFNGRTPDAVARAVLAGERVDTGFDVIAWLFPGMQGGGRRDEDERPRPKVGPALPASSGGGALPRNAPPVGAAPPPDPPPRRAHGPQAEFDPRDLARALASMMMADGRIRASERRFLDATLTRAGAPPLTDADLRVWRPTELGPLPDPAAVIEAMRLLALIDKEADGSELRVLQEFARAWGVKLSKEPLPTPGAMAELGRVLRGLLVR